MNAVGIDVSKGRSTVTIRQPGDVVVLPLRDFRHTQSSINEFIATIKKLNGATKVPSFEQPCPYLCVSLLNAH